MTVILSKHESFIMRLKTLMSIKPCCGLSFSFIDYVIRLCDTGISSPPLFSMQSQQCQL